MLSARLAPDVGALVSKALELATENDSAESFAARSADALAELAEHYLASAAQDDDSRRRSNADRFQVMVHVEARTGDSEIEDGAQLAEETTRRIACDASLLVMTHDNDDNPLSAGRRTRTISLAMRRALYAKDRGCCFPGCTHTRHIEGDHIEHWADGGETKMSNLVTLCSFHHRLIHEGGFEVTFTHDGVFVFTTPAGGRIPNSGHLEKRFSGNIADVVPRIDSETIRSRWRGESLDYTQAIEAMLP